MPKYIILHPSSSNQLSFSFRLLSRGQVIWNFVVSYNLLYYLIFIIFLIVNRCRLLCLNVNIVVVKEILKKLIFSIGLGILNLVKKKLKEKK